MTWHTYIHRKNNWELTSSQNRLRLMDTSSSQVRINDFNDKWTWKPKWWSCHNRMNMLTRLIFVYWGCLGTCSLTPKRPSAHSSYSSSKKKRMKNNCGMPIRSSQYENSYTMWCDVGIRFGKICISMQIPMVFQRIKRQFTLQFYAHSIEHNIPKHTQK